MDSNAISRLTDPVFIRGLLERHGFRFSKALGQNFLTDATVPARIADALCADESCAVLEVGPGIGCLTAELAERAGAVLSVELDRRLEPVLRETLAPFSNTGLLFGDIMKQDLTVLADGRLTAPTRLFCANLPYNITTPVLTKVLESGLFARSVVMIQREVAERLCAAPGGKDYGAFSLLVQWHAEPEMLFTVPPHAFVPQPKVTSAVVRLTQRKEPPFPVKDEALLFRTVRAAFGQRRKTLLNALTAGFPELGRDGCRSAADKSGIDPGCRGEVLGINEFALLSDAIADYL
ncbi:MAG: 16S rRNA (adenine(1518)-N(6)/adenine(1519)-N(6))-dimethyltransferase RsmA [Eubacteriales bacterium]|nr:16S rRNA (adenine(1518)-N(6)/adenine(1519)-N(6))-dimethyltransferase RsmA [Eubacteriales bacterium]